MSDKILVDKKLFSKMVKQIETSSKILEKYAALNKEYLEDIKKICDILEKQGHLNSREKKVVYSDMKNNPIKVAHYIAQYLENNEIRPSLGQPSEYSSSTSDPLYKFCFGSDL